MIFIRFMYTDRQASLPVKVTTWDALGYYMYLPAQFIYHDETELNWFPKIDSTYSVSGGDLYQANRQKNGQFVFKYLEGVSILQTPFFLLAHFVAFHSQYPADGFSTPYQYAVAWGCLIYCLLAIFLLRKILLRYYKDGTVAVTILLLLCASNFLQYTAIEGGQSHGYIFPLYVFLLYVTVRWHENRKLIWSFLMSLIIGVAMISRPTEVVMLFIPLLWGVRSKADIIEKIKFLFKQKAHLLLLISGFILGIAPQLLYWKRVTGSFVYDVGSKWDFLNPHFRVLLGFEKGWFIYTPVTFLFIAGFFFISQQEFKRSVITFCLLNIYIIIAWHIWRYGGSYSCRALVQSYPVFALPLAGLVETVLQKKWNILFFMLSAFLIGVNLFQIKQYNQGILHYDEMNATYYRAIYLNPHPTPLDMSLLDRADMLRNEQDYRSVSFYKDEQGHIIQQDLALYEQNIPAPRDVSIHERWIKVNATIKVEQGLWGTYLMASIKHGGLYKEAKIRLFNALSKEGKTNQYVFFIQSPDIHNELAVRICLTGNPSLKGRLEYLELTELKK